MESYKKSLLADPELLIQGFSFHNVTTCLKLCRLHNRRLHITNPPELTLCNHEKISHIITHLQGVSELWTTDQYKVCSKIVTQAPLAFLPAHSTGTSLRAVNTKGKVFQIDDSPNVHGTDAGADECTAVPGGCRLKEDESQHPANSWTLKTLSRAGIFKNIFKAAAAVEEIRQGALHFLFLSFFFL